MEHQSPVLIDGSDPSNEKNGGVGNPVFAYDIELNKYTDSEYM